MYFVIAEKRLRNEGEGDRRTTRRGASLGGTSEERRGPSVYCRYLVGDMRDVGEGPGGGGDNRRRTWEERQG